MRRTITFTLAASLAVVTGCSDRSPTAPRETNATSSNESTAPTPPPVARPRNPVVVPPRADTWLAPGEWGSAQASLSIAKDGATLEILSQVLPAGACFGQLGDIFGHIPYGRFVLPGSFTQLIGAFPGKIVYPAEYLGSVLGNTLSLTATVPALHKSFGPYHLVRGVTNKWTPCLYP
jgi:hypothetical protein